MKVERCATQICDSVLSKVGELLISLKLWDPICNSPAESLDKIAHRIVNEAEDFLPNWILWKIHLLVEEPLIPSSFCDLLLFNMQEVKKNLILKEDWRGTTSGGGAGIIGNEWKQIYAWKHNAAPEEAGCLDALWENFGEFPCFLAMFRSKTLEIRACWGHICWSTQIDKTETKNTWILRTRGSEILSDPQSLDCSCTDRIIKYVPIGNRMEIKQASEWKSGSWPNMYCSEGALYSKWRGPRRACYS